MEAATARFAERRIEERLEAVRNVGFVSVGPLLELIEAFAVDRERLEFYGLPAGQAERLREMVLVALERGAVDEYLKPPRVAVLVKKTAETVRAWCRSGKVDFYPKGRDYMVSVRSALEHAELL